MSTAWTIILSDTAKEGLSRRLRELFPAEEWIESQEFSLVHKTVLGLNPLNLDDLLASVPTSMINSVDVRGRTALWWTALRGDYSAMSSLLRYDADVQRLSSAGFSSLTTAMFSRNQGCVRLLLQHSHDLARYDSTGWLAIHVAAYCGLDNDVISATIPPEIGVDVVTKGQESTALMHAAQESRFHACKYLLSLNADPNLKNTEGETALHLAISNNSHKSMETLLRCTEYHIKTKAGETFLHYAAQYSDIQSLEILYDSDLYGICIKDTVTNSSPNQTAMNVVGLTALEIAGRRSNVTPEWLAMFQKLQNKIDLHSEELQADTSHGEADEFHDALESQER